LDCLLARWRGVLAQAHAALVNLLWCHAGLLPLFAWTISLKPGAEHSSLPGLVITLGLLWIIFWRDLAAEFPQTLRALSVFAPGLTTIAQTAGLSGPFYSHLALVDSVCFMIGASGFGTRQPRPHRCCVAWFSGHGGGIDGHVSKRHACLSGAVGTPIIRWRDTGLIPPPLVPSWWLMLQLGRPTLAEHHPGSLYSRDCWHV